MSDEKVKENQIFMDAIKNGDLKNVLKIISKLNLSPKEEFIIKLEALFNFFFKSLAEKQEITPYEMKIASDVSHNILKFVLQSEQRKPTFPTSFSFTLEGKKYTLEQDENGIPVFKEEDIVQ